jgi:hypothetical protein
MSAFNVSSGYRAVSTRNEVVSSYLFVVLGILLHFIWGN